MLLVESMIILFINGAQHSFKQGKNFDAGPLTEEKDKIFIDSKTIKNFIQHSNSSMQL